MLRTAVRVAFFALLIGAGDAAWAQAPFLIANDTPGEVPACKNKRAGPPVGTNGGVMLTV